MLFLLFCVIGLVFLFSLLPFLFPGSLIGLLGSFLNAFLAEALGGVLPAWGVGTNPRGESSLTLHGTLAVYLPILAVVFLFMRKGR